MPSDVELSIVLPCLNEEKGIGVCIQKINAQLQQHAIKGEIIVVDNGSTDRSVEIASEEGARIVSERVRGYGSAYLRGLKEVKGTYVLIADSDNTYDFHEIIHFVDKLKQGYEFVIGSRFKGKINKKAMPWLHRYLGNPILSGLCRLFFHTCLSDVHCGMRAFTKEAYQKMKLRTLGMEFATEMVVSALQNRLKICEIPVSYNLREGRSKLRPLYDAWRHIKFMLLYCPVWLYCVPGMFGFVVGMGVVLFLLRGPLLLFGHYWDLHIMILFSAVGILSYQLLNLGICAHMFAVNQGFLKKDRLTYWLKKHFSLEKGISLGMILFCVGIGINIIIFVDWFFKHFGALFRIRESIVATTLLVIGLQTIFSSFFISLLFFKENIKSN